MLSIIIPTLNEEDHIGELLPIIFQKTYSWLEVIVVDGGSTDRTIEIIQEFEQVILIKSEKGRSIQMNEGARRARNGHLLFFHADTLFDSSFLAELPLIIKNTEAGAFTLKFDRSTFWLEFYGWFTKFNYTLFTYGDQGLLISKPLFQEINGFREIPLLEDIDIVRRIKSQTRFQKYTAQVRTSSRRFEKNGQIRQQLINLTIITGYYMGVSPHFLARFYRY